MLIGRYHTETSLEMWRKEHPDKQSAAKYFAQNKKEMMEGDICIFEISAPTMSLGFQINDALAHNKPVVALCLEGTESHILKTITSDKLLVKTYSPKTIAKTVRQALDEAREQRDKRFNFFINPRLLDYIETVSSEQGVTCSHFLRSLILDHMKEFKTTPV